MGGLHIQLGAALAPPILLNLKEIQAGHEVRWGGRLFENGLESHQGAPYLNRPRREM
jgi:hypothetical protein